MAARVTREEARARLLKTFMRALDETTPPGESKPLKGRTFLEWENQGDKLKQAVSRVFQHLQRIGTRAEELPLRPLTRKEPGFYNPDYRTDHDLGDDPARYKSW